MEDDLYPEAAAPEQPDLSDIRTFQDELIQMLAPADARIHELEEILHDSCTARERSCRTIADDLATKLKQVQERMPPVRNSLITLSRRIQALSLWSQAATTLAAPKQIKPIQDDFLHLKDDLDSSLKNIATLGKTLAAKIDTTKPVEPAEAPVCDSEITKQLQAIRAKNDENWHMIENMRFARQLQSTSGSGAQNTDFEQYISEAERIIDELDEASENGLESAQATKAKIMEQTFEGRQSFITLMDQIQTAVDTQLDALHARVREAETKGASAIDAMQEDMMTELAEIAEKCQTTRAVSMLDEIECRNELKEVEALIAEIDELEQEVLVGPCAYEIHKGRRDGKVVRFRCHRDGFFDVL